MSQTPEDAQLLDKLLDATLARLAEHFEAVEILCSRTEGEAGTRCMKRGIGNWYARQGMAHEFIGLARADEVAERINSPTSEN